MKEIKSASKVKLIIALMYRNKDIVKKIKNELIKKYGEIGRESKEYEFNFTAYYKREMGKNLLKQFISFKRLIKREKLRDIRLLTMSIEKKYSKNNKRKINIDPGYITENSIVLASIKERPHKIYLGKGVYADLNLILKKKGFFELPWTFPDYKIKENQEFFHKVREDLKQKIVK